MKRAMGGSPFGSGILVGGLFPEYMGLGLPRPWFFPAWAPLVACGVGWATEMVSRHALAYFERC